MRKGSVVLPENILSKMDPQERKRLGNAGRTQMEISTRQYIQSERKIHDQFCSFLRRHELPFVHTNPTRKSTIVPGFPDFQVTRRIRSIYIEFKIAPNQLQKVQVEYLDFLIHNENIVHVITETEPGTALKWASDIIIEFFNL